MLSDVAIVEWGTVVWLKGGVLNLGFPAVK